MFFNANDFFWCFFYPSQKEILKTAFRIQESAASQLVVSNHDFGRKMPPKKPGVVGPNGLNYGSTHQKIGGGEKRVMFTTFSGGIICFPDLSSKRKNPPRPPKGLGFSIHLVNLRLLDLCVSHDLLEVSGSFGGFWGFWDLVVKKTHLFGVPGTCGNL